MRLVPCKLQPREADRSVVDVILERRAYFAQFKRHKVHRWDPRRARPIPLRQRSCLNFFSVTSRNTGLSAANRHVRKVHFGATRVRVFFESYSSKVSPQTPISCPIDPDIDICGSRTAMVTTPFHTLMRDIHTQLPSLEVRPYRSRRMRTTDRFLHECSSKGSYRTAKFHRMVDLAIAFKKKPAYSLRNMPTASQ